MKLSRRAKGGLAAVGIATALAPLIPAIMDIRRKLQEKRNNRKMVGGTSFGSRGFSTRNHPMKRS